MSVANQKIVQIAPRTKRDADNLFAMMNIDALQAAVQDLKGSALKMWLYFNKNQDSYKFEGEHSSPLQEQRNDTERYPMAERLPPHHARIDCGSTPPRNDVVTVCRGGY